MTAPLNPNEVRRRGGFNGETHVRLADGRRVSLRAALQLPESAADDDVLEAMCRAGVCLTYDQRAAMSDNEAMERLRRASEADCPSCAAERIDILATDISTRFGVQYAEALLRVVCEQPELAAKAAEPRRASDCRTSNPSPRSPPTQFNKEHHMERLEDLNRRLTALEAGSAARRAASSPQEAHRALEAKAAEIRKAGGPDAGRAYVVACEQHPELARAASELSHSTPREPEPAHRQVENTGRAGALRELDTLVDRLAEERSKMAAYGGRSKEQLRAGAWEDVMKLNPGLARRASGSGVEDMSNRLDSALLERVAAYVLSALGPYVGTPYKPAVPGERTWSDNEARFPNQRAADLLAVIQPGVAREFNLTSDEAFSAIAAVAPALADGAAKAPFDPSTTCRVVVGHRDAYVPKSEHAEVDNRRRVP